MAVVAIESPVFWLGASRRVANAARTRIQDAFRKACNTGHRQGQLVVRQASSDDPI
jgi:hypothetical protein